MGKNIFIGNLSPTVTEDDLRSRFEEIGVCHSVQVIKDKITGQSRGFAFVEMDREADAQQAIEVMNGMELGGRKVTVNEARPRQERNRTSGFGRSRFGRGRRQF